MILCLPSNDIPRGREHVSVPAKHLPLLCCPSSSLCHPAHCLMDEADGHGCLPSFRPDSTDTSKREGERETEGNPGSLLNSVAASEHMKDRNLEAAQYQRKWTQTLAKKQPKWTKKHASFIFNMGCISCCQFDLFLSFRVSEETLVAFEKVCSVLNPQ